MDPDALKEVAATIAQKVANKEQMLVPLDCIYWSDGDEKKVPSSSMLVKQDPTDYLEILSKTYSQEYDVDLVFTSLPLNYTVWKMKRGDVFLYGHPRGRFPSAKKFSAHVWSLLNNKLDECECDVCCSGGGEGRSPKS